MVKFIFYLLDLISRTVLLYQQLLEFNLGASLGLVVLSVFAMLAAYASRAAETLSATSFLMAALVMAGASDVDVLLVGILST
ncbi:hypothetical protein Tco_1238309 [Tanacetum coccineum]